MRRAVRVGAMRDVESSEPLLYTGRMGDRMRGLAEFRYDNFIDSDEVDVSIDGEREMMARGEAVELAHAEGKHLYLEWPDQSGVPFCQIGTLALPPRWEHPPEADSPGFRSAEYLVDERLWFEAACGGRDFLIGNGHTFRGRLWAWCPAERGAYNVSLGEIAEMSDESRYFIAGFLAGSEPGMPSDEEGNTADEDRAAWTAATTRFRRTGEWYGRWSTCEDCGCVLLPDARGTACERCSTK